MYGEAFLEEEEPGYDGRHRPLSLAAEVQRITKLLCPCECTCSYARIITLFYMAATTSTGNH